MTSPYSVTGSSIQSKLDFVRALHGAGAARALVADLELPELEPAGWYPFEVYDNLLRQIAARFYGGDLEQLYDVGTFSAEHALTSTFRAVADTGDVVGLIQRFGAVHQRSYSEGFAAVLPDSEERRIAVHLADAPTYSEADLWVAAGFYAGAVQLMGFSDACCRFTLAADGGHLVLTW